MDSLQLEYLSLHQRLIKELELEKSTIEKARYVKKFEALKVIQQHEVKKLELEIQRLRNRVEFMKEQLDALTIKAPRNGLFVRAIHVISGTKVKAGDAVWGNFPLATLPEFEQMKVKITASETDFKMINVNDSVSYTFDAMPGNRGTGKILKKTPIGQPYKRGSTVKFFDIEASIDSVLVMPEPGFTANCQVIFKQVENVFSIPQIAIFEEDSIKVVYVQRKKGYDRRQVLMGLSSPRESIVTAGLEEGDIITLSKPKISLVKERVALPDSLINKIDTPVETPKPENIQGIPSGMPPNMPNRIVQP
jgi:biotin carboxyl carrier protein